MTADAFQSPSVCRGYAAWLGERLHPYQRLTAQEVLCRIVLLRLAVAIEKGER